ncbi:HK97 gp10 family phage protein [Clostridium brassicae]|uniref:HK97 gp10 family phage protein n=1 Tax=Clostridium brassicae TaxID=2999072 RepID=A0ABT4DCW5_9CLOT|nr:HK97 gp10 family phage protein [Clostridium brassicae]MCY6958864.1 HK97 gp10 family phage protein [Clostridium brassicae]
MARLGSFDYSEFRNMAKNFQKALDERVIERWIKEFLLEMAFRAERKIKKRTPVDSGHLRRNWQVGSIEKHGDSYVIEIFNNVEYASYVNNGHRTRNHEEWVEGRFMVEISMNEIERELPRFLERKQVELLNQILNGR